METLAIDQNKMLFDIQMKVDDILNNQENITQESAEKAVNEKLRPFPSGIKALIPFTGYYAMDIAPNAYLGIDTYWAYYSYHRAPKINVKIQVPMVVINLSMDGKTVQSYPFDEHASFDGRTLIISNVIKIDLTRAYQGGQLVGFSGTVNGKSVTGSTFFNPVELPVFVGTYISLITKKPALTVAQSSLMFDFGKGMQNIPFFIYNPAMYVVQFKNNQANYTLMLGTAPAQGLACFITDGKTNGFAVTIP